MKNIFKSLIILSVLILNSCEDNVVDNSYMLNGFKITNKIDYGDDYDLSSGWCATPPIPPTAFLNGTILQVGTFYLGGCEEHEFNIHGNFDRKNMTI